MAEAAHQLPAMDITLAEEHVHTVLNKLDAIRLELLRLGAVLVPKGGMTEVEKREIRAARREYARGKSVTLGDLLKELGE